MNLQRKGRRAVTWAVGVFLTLGTLFPVSAQMDDVTMPGGEKKVPTPLLSESEFNEWAAKPGAVVFELQYRGLKAEEENLVRLSGFSSTQQETPFIKDIGLEKDKYSQFSYPLFHGSEEGIVEYEGKTAKALYLDLNCDGKLGPGEKLEPAWKSKEKTDRWYFVTSDFTLPLPDGKQALLRMIAQVNFYSDQTVVMLAPFCAWEGKAIVADTEATLCLVDGNNNGSFVDFGDDFIQLTRGPQSSSEKDPLPRTPLSSLMYLDDTCYQLRFTGQGTKDKPLRAVLCKDTRPTGKIEFKMVLAAPEPKILKLRLISSETPSAQLEIKSSGAHIPEGRYQVASGKLVFGTKGSGSVSFQKGPEFRITANQTTPIELGKPRIQLIAMEEGKQLFSPWKAETSFPLGTPVYLAVQLIGAHGEEYGYIYTDKTGQDCPARNPRLQIFGPDGQKVASADLEHG